SPTQHCVITSARCRLKKSACLMPTSSPQRTLSSNMSENLKSNAERPKPTSLSGIPDLLADAQKSTPEIDRALVRELLRTRQGQAAIREGLLRTAEGRQLVAGEFGITVVDRSDRDGKPIVALLIPTHKKPENETGNALAKMIPEARKACHIIERP